MQKYSTKYWQSKFSNTLKGSYTMIKCDLPQGCKDFFFNICKSIHVIDYINKPKNKNNMIISLMQKKRLWPKSTPIYDKNSPESGHGGNLPQHNGGHLWQTHIIPNGDKWKVFHLRSGTRRGCTLLPLLFNIVLEFLAMAIRNK